MAEFSELETPDMHDVFEGDGWPPAVKNLFLVLLGGALALLFPYVLTYAMAEGGASKERLEKVQEYQVWMKGDPIPFEAAMARFRASFGAEKELADAGLQPETVIGVDGDPEIEDFELPAIDEEGMAAGEKAADSDGKTPEESGEEAPKKVEKHPWSRIHLPSSLWADAKVMIEDPHEVMAPVWEKLANVLLKKEGESLVISHFGDSSIAADGMPSSFRRHLQRIGGDGGHGYSLVSASNNWYRRKDVTWSNRGFKNSVYISDQAKDKRYGFGGTVSVGYRGARASWETVKPEEGESLEKLSGSRVSSFTVYYQGSKRGGVFKVFLDGEELEEVDVQDEDEKDAVKHFHFQDGPHQLELRVTEKSVAFYGVALERKGGIVVDGLGTIGARDTRWRNYDEDHVKWAFETRKPDLAMFMYGGNQLEDKLSMAAYEERLVDVVRLWKEALSGSACLLVSATDHGERYRGRVRTVPRQLEIMAVQKKVALEEGCAWFSLYDAMGGEGAVGTWFSEGLVSGDLAHPTAKGSILLGKLMFQSFMKGFHEQLDKTLLLHENGGLLPVEKKPEEGDAPEEGAASEEGSVPEEDAVPEDGAAPEEGDLKAD